MKLHVNSIVCFSIIGLVGNRQVFLKPGVNLLITTDFENNFRFILFAFNNYHILGCVCHLKSLVDTQPDNPNDLSR